MTTKTKQSVPVGRQAETQKIPKLRFAGFSDEWEEKRLGEIFPEIKSGKDKPETEGKYFVHGSTGVIGNIRHFTYEGEHILVARVGANAGKLNRVSGKFGVTDNTLVLENGNDADINFFFNFLGSKKINRLVFGSGQPLITSGQLKKLKIIIPQGKNEQQKIAEFLGAVDGWIENLRAQKENLEFYKKGMMQKIFAQEIRFKDDKGNEFPKWEEKKLREVGNIVTGTTPSTAHKEYYGGDFPWITPTDINNEKSIYTSAKLLTKKGLDAGRFVSKNSLLVTCIASIGKNTILRVDGSCNQQINAISPNNKNNVDFLYYLIEENKNILIRFAGAGGMQMLNKKDFSGLKFFIPSLLEQQKIANFLTSFDNVIESKQQQITQAKQWKKGLIQGLFV